MDNSEKYAVAAILSEYNRYFIGLQKDRALKLEVDARIAVSERRWPDFVGAFKVFGFEGLDSPMWQRLRESLGEEVYLAALAKGKLLAEGTSEEPQHIELKAIEVSADQRAVTHPERPKIRDTVLTLLQEKGTTGDGATALRKSIESQYRIELHEKTVGMTLYRLSREGLVRREGKTWFFVPQVAEKKNPGVDAPGQTSLLDEGGTDA